MAIKDAKLNMEKAVEHLQDQLRKIRTGRAAPELVEDIKVDAYGSTQPLKALANISTPGPRELLISPWDKNSTADIVKALESSDLGLNPNVAGDTIKLILPELSSERRTELIKLISVEQEKTKIALRNIREAYLRDIKNQVDKKTASEDDLKHGKKEIQELIDEMNEKIITIVRTKTLQIKSV